MALLNNIQLPEYCEKSVTAVIAQPANTASAFLMLVVGTLGYRLWRQRGNGDRGNLLLIAAVFLVGVGSILFHAMPNPLTLFADLVPILVFIVGAFVLILNRLLGQTFLQTGLHICGFLIAVLMVTLMFTPRALGNGAWFVVPLLTLYVLGGTLVLRARLAMSENRHLVGRQAERLDREVFPQLKMGYALLQCGLVLAIGILVRAYDVSLCGRFPLGLHFVWHIVVAGAVYILLLACIRYTTPGGAIRAVQGGYRRV